MGFTRKALMSRTVVVVPVNQDGLRAIWIGPYFTVEKIRWNENAKMVRVWREDVRSFVTQSGQRAKQNKIRL